MIGTIILTLDNFYVDEHGNIPSRRGVEFDKELLRTFIRGEVISERAAAILPPSLVKEANHIAQVGTVAITIPEIADCDILIITRSREQIIRGKQFRLDDFELVVKQRDIEIWRRR